MSTWAPLATAQTALAIAAGSAEPLIGMPCPMLGSDGRCTAYAWRPWTCRRHYVVSPPEDCRIDIAAPPQRVQLLSFDDRELVDHLWGRAAVDGSGYVAPLVMLLAAFVEPGEDDSILAALRAGSRVRCATAEHPIYVWPQRAEMRP